MSQWLLFRVREAGMRHDESMEQVSLTGGGVGMLDSHMYRLKYSLVNKTLALCYIQLFTHGNRTGMVQYVSLL